MPLASDARPQGKPNSLVLQPLLPIDISSVLAFKPSLRLLWRNDPALQLVPLFDSPGGTETGAVFAPLNKLDSFFNLSLLFKF